MNNKNFNHFWIILQWFFADPLAQKMYPILVVTNTDIVNLLYCTLTTIFDGVKSSDLFPKTGVVGALPLRHAFS